MDIHGYIRIRIREILWLRIYPYPHIHEEPYWEYHWVFGQPLGDQ
jgi:hypothetical protein